MSKPLRKIIFKPNQKGYTPKPKQEKRFVDLHDTEMTDHEDIGDDVFKATNIKSAPYKGKKIEEENELNENDDLTTRKKIEILRSKSSHITADHITKALTDKAWEVRYHAIRHPNVNADHINTALNDKIWYVRWNALRHPNITADHITKALMDKDPDVRKSAVKHPNANADHITKALTDKDPYVKRAAQQRLKSLKEENELNENDDLTTRKKIEILRSKSPNVTAEHISQALKDKNWRVRLYAINHPNANADHISTALNDKDWGVRSYAIQHPNANADNISTALKDKNYKVRWNALRHHNVNADHINQALNDEDWGVRQIAQERLKSLKEEALNENDDLTTKKKIEILRSKSPNVTAEHISQALKDKNPNVRWYAIQHPNVNADHISQALKDENPLVKLHAIHHPNVNADHISAALKDKHYGVRLIAQKRLKSLKEETLDEGRVKAWLMDMEYHAHDQLENNDKKTAKENFLKKYPGQHAVFDNVVKQHEETNGVEQ